MRSLITHGLTVLAAMALLIPAALADEPAGVTETVQVAEGACPNCAINPSDVICSDCHPEAYEGVSGAPMRVPMRETDGVYGRGDFSLAPGDYLFALGGDPNSAFSLRDPEGEELVLIDLAAGHTTPADALVGEGYTTPDDAPADPNYTVAGDAPQGEGYTTPADAPQGTHTTGSDALTPAEGYVTAADAITLSPGTYVYRDPSYPDAIYEISVPIIGR